MSQTVLVADDSKTIRQIVEMALKASPWDVVGVGSAQDALQAARQNPSVILLDYYMPDGSGYEVCRALKGNAGTSGIPIVMLGGTYREFDEGLARQAGADAVLMKPFKTEALFNALESAKNGASAAPPVPTSEGAPTIESEAEQTPQPEPVYDKEPAKTPRRPIQSTPDKTPPPASQPRIPTEPARSESSPDINASSRQPMPTPTPGGSSSSPSQTPAASAGLSRAEVEKMVKEEVKAAVRRELPGLLRNVMGEIFQQKVLPKLMSHAEQRVKAVVAENLNTQIQDQVRIELERLLEE